jgi:hypothetical protein
VAQVKLLDIDEDGIKDLVVADSRTGMSWIKNMGSGFFGEKLPLSYNTYMTNFEVGDMDNDGKLDIILAQLNGDSMHFLRNTGGGTFVYESMFYAPNYNIYSYAFGDLDQDQVTDLIVSSGDSNPQRVIQFEYVNGAFVQKNVYASNSSPYVYQSYLYDIDNDGKTDVVTASSDCVTYWFKNFGANVYSTMTPITINGCMNYSMKEVGDLNLDGFMDILYAKNNDIAYKAGTGVGELSTVMQSISGNSIVGTVGRTSLFDIDQDGDLDIFYSTDNEFGWFANNASALSTQENVAAKFTIYPNPASSEIHIASTKEVDSYKIYDNTGKLVGNETFQIPTTGCKIDLSQLSSGFYFLDIQSGSSREIKKFVKR